MPPIDLDATVVGFRAAFGPGSNARSQTRGVYLVGAGVRVVTATTAGIIIVAQLLLLLLLLKHHLSRVSDGVHARREGLLLGLALCLARRQWFFAASSDNSSSSSISISSIGGHDGWFERISNDAYVRDQSINQSINQSMHVLFSSCDVGQLCRFL